MANRPTLSIHQIMHHFNRSLTLKNISLQKFFKMLDIWPQDNAQNSLKTVAIDPTLVIILALSPGLKVQDRII